MEIQLPIIDNNRDGYKNLINLELSLEDCVFEDIEINISSWFSANLCAWLGSILDKAARYNSVKINVLSEKIQSILLGNGFLANFGYEKRFDCYSAVQYLKLNPKENRFFNEYIINNLLQKKEFPNVSDKLKKKIVESICEIFVNAQIHSETDCIYVCGQFFRKKNEIEFTIVDRGLGFKKKINDRLHKNFNGVEAIKWALESGNTTKKDVPGGIGLDILKQFIILNKGSVQIVSDDSFLEFDSQKENSEILNKSFKGTVINMKFKTDDNNSYILSDEVKSDDIF